MRKNKNYKKLFSLIFMIIVFICFQTIVYSAFSSTMNISGIGISRVEANVRITDFRISTTNNATSSFEEFGKNHIVTEIDLLDSTSSITYYLEITNYGSTDVGIFNITGLPSGVSYSIKDYNLKDKICDDSGKCNSLITKTYELTLTSTSTYSGNIQMNFDFRIFHKVIYEGIENKGYPVEVIDGGNLIIPFKEDLERVQVLSNNTEIDFYSRISNNQSINVSNITSDIIVKIKPRVAKLVSGSLSEVGSEVCIGNECFYVISNDGSTVTMLSKYNLYVGNSIADTSFTEAPLKNPTGIQNSTAIGAKYDSEYNPIDLPWYGTIAYSATSYWWDSTNNTFKTGYPADAEVGGKSYPYVYNSNSSLYKPVQNYKTYLESQGANIEEARLIKINELFELGCSASDVSCASAPEWVYGTSYWTGGAANSDFVIAVSRDGAFGGSSYSSSRGNGVRPVIELDINEIYIPPVRIVSGDLQTVGSEVAIGDEHFYIISSDEDSVTMLAKYNLEVGNVCTSKSSCTPIENPSGLQNSTMIGYPTDGSYPRYGTTVFSSKNYWYSGGLKAEYGTSYPAYVYDSNSKLYNYVESYRTYLESQGAEIEEARLISYDELIALGCSGSSCKSAPSWVYGTSYWSGSANSSRTVWNVGSDRSFSSIDFSNSFSFGCRPVITLTL